MKTDEVKSRLDFITSAIITAHLAQPPTQEELDWLAGMAEIQQFFVPVEPQPDDEAEYRRLFWEQKLGVADWIDAPLDPADFVSKEAYQQCL